MNIASRLYCVPSPSRSRRGDNFFVDSGLELQPGAREKLNAALDVARKCPSNITVLAKFLPGVPLGVPSFAPVGPDPDRWGLVNRLLRESSDWAGNWDFQVKQSSSGFTSADINFTQIEVRWTLKPDQKRPVLDVVWTPSNGSKVKAGDKITAAVTARDEGTTAQTAQTGVARIRVDIGVGGGLVGPAAQYSAPTPLQECGRQNPVRTYEATYTVPSCDPPLVQLRANAMDFANNEIWKDAEFPVDRQEEEECQDEDERRDAGGGQDSGGQGNPCVRRNIVRGLDFSFPCP
jgi:hypothetical protein